MTTFAEAVREIRRMHGLSQGELSEATGKSQSWASRLECGKHEPTLSDLALLSHLFGLELTRGEWKVRPLRGAKPAEERYAVRA